MDHLLVNAKQNQYGIIAVSCFSLDLVKAAVRAAESKNSPLIININLRYDFLETENDIEQFLSHARKCAKDAKVPVAINLDHGKDFQTVLKGLRNGFTSVMIDASDKPFEENVRIVSEVTTIAHQLNIPVEAELGCVGMADQSFSIDDKYTQSTKTDPNSVKEFVERTNVDFLAVSIGNAHGPYAKNEVPHIDFELLEALVIATDIPLVLHGGSGIKDSDLTKACKLGITKINVGTDLMELGASMATQKYQENQNLGRLKFLTHYISEYQKGIEHFMDVFNSTDKAILYSNH